MYKECQKETWEIDTKVKREERRMKIMKKLAMLLLSVCLIVPCFAMLTYAAEGQIMFSDPAAEGGTVQVKGVVRAGAPIGDADVTMTYDPAYLKFKSGDNVTEFGNGQLSYSGKGTGTESELVFYMEFEALKEGTTKIEISNYKSYLFSDETLNCAEGSSTITIAADAVSAPTADNTDANTTEGATTGAKVTVSGKEYELSGNFPASEIPTGFAETTISYQGVEHKALKQDKEDIYLAYLVDDQNTGKFFLYDSKNESFVPFEQINISETAAIMLLSDRGDVKLPKQYQETEITVNGQVFPAWRSAEKSDYYILYAMNNQGIKSLYQYDSVDGTYQRFDAPSVTEKKQGNSFLEKVTGLVEKNLSYAILGTVVLILILIVILIIIAVKLHNRNAELDELYDEFGIDIEEELLDTEEEETPSDLEKPEKEAGYEENVSKEPFGEGFEEDDFEDDDYEEGDFEDDDFEDDDYEEDDFEDDDFEDDDYEAESPSSAKVKKTTYDDFDLDFIDLDD